MNRETVILAYCLDNMSVADEIEGQLSAARIQFKHFYGTENLDELTLAEKLSDTDLPIILIISDNFLKSAQCMGLGIEMLQKKNGQVFPVIVDGIEKDEQSGEISHVQTNFDRVSDIIKYINFWQDQYLELRRKKKSVPDLDEDKFNARLKRLRDISSEVGEFLRLLRSMDHHTYESFANNDFERFFRFLDDLEAWNDFRERKKNTLDLQPVLGNEKEIDLEPEHIPSAEEELTESPLAVEEETTAQQEEAIPDMELYQPDHDEDEVANETAEVDTAAAPPSSEPEDVEAPSSIDDTPPQEQVQQQTIELVIEGLSYFDAGKIEEALEVMAKAVEQNPEDPDLRYHYALMLAKDSRDLSGAAYQLQQVLEIAPDNIDAHLLLGKVAEQQKDYTAAIYHFEKILEIDPKYQGIHYKLGTVILNNFEDQKEVAASYFQEAIKHNPKNTYATYRYAKLLSESYGNKEEAIAYFKKVLDIEPDHPVANFDIALTYYQLGDRHRAREFYQKAIEINPDLKTPQNEELFLVEVSAELPETTTAPPVTEASEEVTLEALRNNINRLEAIFRAKKEEEPPLPPLKETIVFIVGADSQIGRATAEVFAANNYKLLLHSHSEEELLNLKAHLESEYRTVVKVLSFDIADGPAAEFALSSVESQWQQIDILLNYAGSDEPGTDQDQGILQQWEKMIDTNIKGLFGLTRLVARGMIERKRGHIINIASIAGQEVYPGGSIFGTSKFAIDAMTKAMRIDLHKHRIKVSQICPGIVRTTNFSFAAPTPQAENSAESGSGSNKLSAEDVAETIFFVATRPAHVNVQDITMAG